MGQQMMIRMAPGYWCPRCSTWAGTDQVRRPRGSIGYRVRTREIGRGEI